MKLLTPCLALALIALSEPATAQLVPVEWDAAGRFGKELPIQPGKFIEVCEKLPKGAKVAWSFEAATRVDFNIHYHEGKEVRFPAKKDQIAKDAGTLVAKVEQDYCWMWKNKGADKATLRFKLAKG
ncbi:hypothetical protein [Aquabacterium sp.]|uniref:hypothetical protein n=1 Tax=Aquabacterium sp. TaxID=1872578 RepID=UPI002C30EE17|nr:hypothetical protein [Aquabacterium sp.]HSW08015.1 hypothetical protein [Aquabacterium sp.]